MAENQNVQNPPVNQDPPANNQFNDLNPNLDLLADPDTGADANNPAATDMLSGLKNLDPVNENNQNNPPANPPGNAQNQQNPNDPLQNQNLTGFEKYKEKLKSAWEKAGAGAEFPQDLNEDNFIDKMGEFYSKNAKPSLNPEVEKFQKAIESGVAPDEYFTTMQGMLQVEKMPARDLVQLSLKQNFGKSETKPNGWDEAKINETIEKMDKAGFLEIEAEKIRAGYTEEKQRVADSLIAKQNETRTAEITTMNQQREEGIKKSLQTLDGLTQVAGLPITQSEKAEFANEFRYLVTPDEKSGTSPLLDMLQSDEVLVQVAYFLAKGQSKVKEHLTRAKEGAKKEFFNKLDPEPKTPNRGAHVPSSEIDLDALSAPATN